MYAGKLVFAQITEHLPLPIFRQCVKRYRGHHKVKSFTCFDQFLCMMFAQLTYRESLRDIEACLPACAPKQTVSYGDTRRRFAEYAGQRKPGPRLANLR